MKKRDLIRAFFAVGEEEIELGALALKDLPETPFRQVVSAHNERLDGVLDHAPEEWRDLRGELKRLRVPTYEEFQGRLDDSLQRKQVAPQYRKARDFRMYRAWVLEEPPLSTVFRKTFRSRRFPAYVPEKFRRRHCFVVGRSGSGKSEALKLLALTAKCHRNGSLRRDRSLLLLDPHGDLAEELAVQQCYAADFENNPGDPDLVYLDPFLAARRGRFPTLNPLDISGKGLSDFQIEKLAQQLMRVLQSLVTREDDALSVNMETVLIPCLTVLLHRPGSTLHDLLRFLEDADGTNSDLLELGKNSRNTGHRQFFQTSFSQKRFAPTKGALSTKIQSLLNHEICARFLAEPRSTVDLDAVLNGGKTLIVNCAAGKVGSQTMEAVGRFVVGMVLGLAFNRAETAKADRTPIWMFLDEAQNFVSGGGIKTILAEARKYALHLTLATQVVGQDMSPRLTRIVLGNTAVKLVGDAGADSQALMAKELFVPTVDFSGLEVGEFLLKCGASPALRMRMGAAHLGRRTAMSSEQWQRLRRFQIERYYRNVEVRDPELAQLQEDLEKPPLPEQHLVARDRPCFPDAVPVISHEEEKQ